MPHDVRPSLTVSLEPLSLGCERMKKLSDRLSANRIWVLLHVEYESYGRVAVVRSAV